MTICNFIYNGIALRQVAWLLLLLLLPLRFPQQNLTRCVHHPCIDLSPPFTGLCSLACAHWAVPQHPLGHGTVRTKETTNPV